MIQILPSTWREMHMNALNNYNPARPTQDPAGNDGHVEFLKTLPLEWTEIKDGNQRSFTLVITTDRGTRTVDYYPATGAWKVRDGKGEGFGIPKMARYFHIGGFPKNHVPPVINEYEQEQREYGQRDGL